MRPFNPNRFFGWVHSSANNFFAFPDGTIVFNIKFVNSDGTLLLPIGTILGFVVVYDVGFSIFVEKERRVDVFHFGQQNGIAPTLQWIFGFHKEIAHSAHIGGNHVERFVVWIVLDGWCKNAFRNALCSIIQLRLTVENMPNLFPVYQVGTCKNGHSWEISKRRVHQIIGISFPANRRVGIIAGHHRIEKLRM